MQEPFFNGRISQERSAKVLLHTVQGTFDAERSVSSLNSEKSPESPFGTTASDLSADIWKMHLKKIEVLFKRISVFFGMGSLFVVKTVEKIASHTIDDLRR